MPTLNSEAFLDERLDSIASQTLTDWELVVVDSASEDATLPRLEAFAREHAGKVSIRQGPRDGVYTNVNRGIDASVGRYLYIATSDDTMAPDCLERLAGALDGHPSCGLAHCRLVQIDARGRRDERGWWEDDSAFARGHGEWVDRTHVRRAPFDGLLHALGRTVYVSLTQLLIRRSLREKIGPFRSTWGSVSDFYWDMRAGLAADTVHVADTWASWRLHDTQATSGAGLFSAKHQEKIAAMIDAALADGAGDLDPELRRWVESSWRPRLDDLLGLVGELDAASSPMKRQAAVLGGLLRGSYAARRYWATKLAGGPSLARGLPGWLRDELERRLGEPVLVPTTVGAAASPEPPAIVSS